MKSSSVSTSRSLKKRGPTTCFCSKRPVLVVSWTPDNPDRRFYRLDFSNGMIMKSVSVARFIGLLSPLLLSPAKGSSFYRRLHRWQTIGYPHILAIDGILVSNVCSPLITRMDILFSIFLIEKDARNGMDTWYANYVPLPTVALGFSQIYSENFQAILHFKVGTTTQHASHLLQAIFSLYNLFLILGHSSDSTFIIISLFA
nr:hypothetical protein CFP56_65034 [Quercus suber]